MGTLKVDTITDEAGTGSPTFSFGLILDATTMTNAGASLLGLKDYVHGTTYASGNAPTVTPSSGTVQRATFVPYKLQSGKWRVKCFIYVNSVSATSSPTFTVNDLTGDNTASYYQAFTCTTGGSSASIQFARIGDNSTTWEMQFSANTTSYIVSADVLAKTKPNWVY